MMKVMHANQAKAETHHKDFLARMDARWNAWREIMNPNHDEMVAYQEVEARPQEKEPTSVDTKPEAAEERQVPEGNATVMPVEEPKKKRRRDRLLAAECRRHKQKISTQENGAPQKKLPVACRKVSHCATVAWHKRNIFWQNTTCRAQVARQMENVAGRNCTMAVIERATQRVGLLTKNLRTHHEGKRGTKNIGGRWPLCQKRKVPTKNDIGRCRAGQRLHLGRRGTRKKTPYETVNVKITKQITRFTAGLLPVKNWTLWKGRPSPKRKKGNGPYGRDW
jgi:hypothetical protein